MAKKDHDTSNDLHDTIVDLKPPRHERQGFRPGEVIRGRQILNFEAPSPKDKVGAGSGKAVIKHGAQGCGILVLGGLIAVIAFPLIIFAMIGILKGGNAIIQKTLLEPEQRHETQVRQQIAADRNSRQHVATPPSVKPTTKQAAASKPFAKKGK